MFEISVFLQTKQNQKQTNNVHSSFNRSKYWDTFEKYSSKVMAYTFQFFCDGTSSFWS